jgi:hypothetical protein
MINESNFNFNFDGAPAEDQDDVIKPKKKRVEKENNVDEENFDIPIDDE